MAALDLGAAGSAPAVEALPAGAAWWGWALGAAPFLLAGLLAWRLPRRGTGGGWRAPLDLRSLPPAGKLLVLFFLAAIVLTHLFAAGAIWQATRVAFHGNAEYFRFARPLHLFRMSHQHAFGHGTMYFLLGALVLCARAPERAKVLAVALTSLGAGADLASWWLQKYGGPSFEPLSVGGGLSFAAGTALAVALIFRNLVRPRA